MHTNTVLSGNRYIARLDRTIADKQNIPASSPLNFMDVKRMNNMKREDGFTMVDNNLIDVLDKLEGNTVKVYLAIRSCVDGSDETKSAWPSREWIADKVGLQVHAIDRHIRILLAFGIIEKKRRFNASSVYTFSSQNVTLLQEGNKEKERFHATPIERSNVFVPNEVTFVGEANNNHEQEPSKENNNLKEEDLEVAQEQNTPSQLLEATPPNSVMNIDANAITNAISNFRFEEPEVIISKEDMDNAYKEASSELPNSSNVTSREVLEEQALALLNKPNITKASKASIRTVFEQWKSNLISDENFAMTLDWNW